MTNLDNVLKSRDITLQRKFHIVKAMVFPISNHVWIQELEYRETDPWRVGAFELWCWRRFLIVPWTTRSKQSILKEISPEYSLEGLMLKLKLQYFGHLMQKADSLGKTLSWERLKAGGEEDDRGWDGWMALLTQWRWIWGNSGRWWKTEEPGVLQSMGLQSQMQLSEWTITTKTLALGTRWAHCYWRVGHFCALSGDIARLYMCVYQPMYMCIFISDSM